MNTEHPKSLSWKFWEIFSGKMRDLDLKSWDWEKRGEDLKLLERKTWDFKTKSLSREIWDERIKSLSGKIWDEHLESLSRKIWHENPKSLSWKLWDEDLKSRNEKLRRPLQKNKSFGNLSLCQFTGGFFCQFFLGRPSNFQQVRKMWDLTNLPLHRFHFSRKNCGKQRLQ